MSRNSRKPNCRSNSKWRNKWRSKSRVRTNCMWKIVIALSRIPVCDWREGRATSRNRWRRDRWSSSAAWLFRPQKHRNKTSGSSRPTSSRNNPRCNTKTWPHTQPTATNYSRASASAQPHPPLQLPSTSSTTSRPTPRNLFQRSGRYDPILLWFIHIIIILYQKVNDKYGEM